jgi:RNA polymerase sigma factor (sigma-70 family)
MTTTRATVILKQIRELATSEDFARLADGELLERFTGKHDPAAFETLLRRYGPLVLGVCRRVLANRQDGEDAFQATFLVLAQKAAAVRKHGSLASWLHGVAYRIALKARARSAQRRRHEAHAPGRASADPLAEVTGRELTAVLDEELQRLSERYRTPLVLCYLEGKTRDEAAAQLRWSLSTLQRRLEKGRELLRGRLARRGLALPAALLAAGIAQGAAAATPPRLAAATLRIAAEAAGGAAEEGTISAAVASLAAGVLRAAAPGRVTVAAGLLLALGTLALGLASGAAAARSEQGEKAPALKGPTGPAMAPPRRAQGSAQPNAATELVVSGRVLDEAGKRGLQADLILVGTWRAKGAYQPAQAEVLARGRCDKDGNYRLAVKGVNPARYEEFHVLARAQGLGLGCRQVDRSADPWPTNVYLQPEQPVTVTLIDLQGQPAAGVKVSVQSFAERTVPAGYSAEMSRAEMTGRRLQLRIVSDRLIQGAAFAPLPPAEGVSYGATTQATTDARGRFTLRGFAQNHVLRLLTEGERFAVQELRLKTDAGAAKQVTLPLAPAHWLEGRVVCEDSGQPLAGATLVALTTLERELTTEELINLQIAGSFGPPPLNRTTARTDAEGRYRLPLAPGDTVHLRTFAPDGVPYLGVQKTVKPARGAARHTLRIALPRGIEVRGRVSEEASGALVTNAELYFFPQRENNPRIRHDLLIGEGYPAFTGQDGRYRIVVPASPGHLLFRRPGQGFIERPITRGELYTGRPVAGRRFDGHFGDERVCFHAIRRLDLAPQAEPHELPVMVRRGVTLRGRLVGPDGQAVPRAVLFCGSELLEAQESALRVSGLYGDLGRAIPLPEGRFELHGCDPAKTYCLYFLSDPRKDAKEPRGAFVNEPLDSVLPRLGAMVRLSPAAAGGKPVTVRLQPCGAVEFRCLDARGRPLARVPESKGSWKSVFKDGDGKVLSQQPYLHLGVEPRQGKFAAEWTFVGFPFDASGYRSPFATDKEGRVRLTGLIPGATYRLRLVDEESTDAEGHPREWGREFTVEPGQTRRLPDLVLPMAF